MAPLRTRILLLAGLAILGGACTSTSDRPPKPAAGQVAQTGTPPPGPFGLKVEALELPASNGKIYVGVQIHNPAGAEARFYWDQLTVTWPDGSTAAAYRSPASAPYELLNPGGTRADGGYFTNVTETYVPGHYVVKYAGAVLKEGDL